MKAEEYIKRKLEDGKLTHSQIAELTRITQEKFGLFIDGKPGPETLEWLSKWANAGEIRKELGIDRDDPIPDTEPGGGIVLETDPAKWLHGVDTSRYQDSKASKYVDWAKVVAHANPQIKFAIVKATEGQTYTDPEFSKSWQDLGALVERDLIIRGAYHFMQPDVGNGDPQKEADHACNVIGELTKGTLPIVGDLEDRHGLPPKDQLVPWVIAWCERVEANTGIKPILYTYTSYWAEELRRTKELEKYILWQAHYKNTLSKLPTQLGNWNWLFWQWTVEKSSSIAGIKGGLDRNVFRGSETDLKRLARLV